MSMDHFMEEVVVKRKNTVNRIVYALSWAVLVFSVFLAMMSFSGIMGQGGFNVYALITTLVFGGTAVAIFLFHDRLLTEYEYTFTNGALDFAEVYNNRKRKSLGSLNVKRMNWFLNREAELYFFFFSKDNSKKMIILEPSEELVGLIKLYIPRGVLQDH